MIDRPPNLFKQENAFYEANYEMLCREHWDKEVVIVGNQLIGVYDTLGKAIRETEKTYPLGTFCVKHVEEKQGPVWMPYVCWSGK
jgi:hypothetical protein